MFPSSKYSKMIDHTKNATGKIAQKIPISTAPELLPDWRIAQIAVTVSRTADVNDVTTANARRPMCDSIGKSSSEGAAPATTDAASNAIEHRNGRTDHSLKSASAQ